MAYYRLIWCTKKRRLITQLESTARYYQRKLYKIDYPSGQSFSSPFPCREASTSKEKGIPPSPRTLKCYSCVLKRQMPPSVPLHKLHRKWQPQQVASQGRPAPGAVLCNFPPFLISQRNAFLKEAHRWAAGGSWLSIRTFQVPLRNFVGLASIKVIWVSLKASWTGRSQGSQGISVTRKLEGGSLEW